MHPEPLLAAFGKVEWAITQIDQLNRQINAYFDNTPYGLVSNVEPDGPRVEPIKVWRIRHSEPVPPAIYAQVGVVLGLLREPLDQVVSATCSKRGLSESGRGFVFGETREKFEAALRESEKIPSDVRTAIAEFEPFFGGIGHLLAALHYLKNPDKHRSPLIPMMLDTIIASKDLKVYNGPLFTKGARTGVHMRFDVDTHSLVQPDPERRPIFTKESGEGRLMYRSLPSTPVKDRMEFATTALVTELKAEFEATFSITFSEVSRMHSEPITSVLTQARDMVESVLVGFERRFFL